MGHFILFYFRILFVLFSSRRTQEQNFIIDSNTDDGRPGKKNCIHQFYVDTGCLLKDLPRAMADRNGWKEREREREREMNLYSEHTLIMMIMMTLLLVRCFNFEFYLYLKVYSLINLNIVVIVITQSKSAQDRLVSDVLGGPYKFRVFQHHTCSPKRPYRNYYSSWRSCSKKFAK